MPAQIKKYKAAAVTAEPGWFDLEASVQKTIYWINEAGKAGCKLLAFPEVCTSPLEFVNLRRPESTFALSPLTEACRDSGLSLLDVEDQLSAVSALPQILP